MAQTLESDLFNNFIEMEKEKAEWTDDALATKLKEVYNKNTAVMITASGRQIDDNEWMHCDADQLLEDFLRAIGYNKSADQYEEMSNNFRYA